MERMVSDMLHDMALEIEQRIRAQLNEYGQAALPVTEREEVVARAAKEIVEYYEGPQDEASNKVTADEDEDAENAEDAA